MARMLFSLKGGRILTKILIMNYVWHHDNPCLVRTIRVLGLTTPIVSLVRIIFSKHWSMWFRTYCTIILIMQHCICVLHTLTLHIYIEIFALVFYSVEGETETILMHQESSYFCGRYIIDIVDFVFSVEICREIKLDFYLIWYHCMRSSRCANFLCSSIWKSHFPIRKSKIGCLTNHRRLKG